MLFVGAGTVEPPVIGHVHHQLGLLPDEAAHPASHNILKADKRDDPHRNGASGTDGHGNGAGGTPGRIIQAHGCSGGSLKGFFQKRECFPHRDIFTEGNQHGLGVRTGCGIIPLKDGKAVVSPRHTPLIRQVNIIRARQQDKIAYPVPEGLDVILFRAQKVDIVLIGEAFPCGITVKRGNGEGTFRPDDPCRHIQGGFRAVFDRLFQSAVLKIQHSLFRHVQQSPVNASPVGRIPFFLLAQIQLHGHDGNGKPAVSRNRGRLGGVASRPAHADDKHG